MTTRIALLVLLLAAATAHAENFTTVDGSKCPNSTTATVCKAAPGTTYLWSEASTADSGTLCFTTPWSCSNTGATNFTVYEASIAGVSLGEYFGPILPGEATSSCSPDSATDTCSKVEGDVGCIILTPDATGASAECRSRALR